MLELRRLCGSGLACCWVAGLLWLTVATGSAQPAKPRAFAPETLEEIRDTRRFDYGREPLPPELNPEQVRNGLEGLAKGVRLVLYGIAVLLVGSIAFFLIRSSLQANRRLQTDTGALPEVTEASLVTLDFLQLAGKAEAEEQYAEAIRYHFLHVLQLLQTNHLIDWRPAKTNDALARDLPPGSLKQAFLGLVFRYEYVCYGQHPLRAQTYEQVKQPFLDFSQHLQPANP